MSKVPVQKGKIKCDVPVMKTMKRVQMNNEDSMNDKARKDGQILKFHTPKK
jgi:hypothetical protein